MAAQKVTVSVAIATFNEEKNIDACLGAVSSWVDEIVVVDGGSKDKTVREAKKHNARVIETDNPVMFHRNKQKALDACRSDWILQLDADEVAPLELKEEILSILVSPKAHEGYYVPRKNYFLGHWLSKGGQYPDYVIRFFKKGKGMFPQKSVHEQIKITGTTGYMKQPLLHYTSRTLNEYWHKSDTYTTLTAKELKRKGAGKNPWMFVKHMVFFPSWTFIQLFVRHKGFMDGVWGFLFALFSGLHHSTSYVKYLRNIGI